MSWPQYCSLKDPESLGIVDPASPLRVAWPQWIVTHFSLYAAGIEAIATGTDALLEDLLEHGFRKDFSVPRGE
jgi:hypothetical protein